MFNIKFHHFSVFVDFVMILLNHAAYKDLPDRTETRRSAWEFPGWDECVVRTGERNNTLLFEHSTCTPSSTHTRTHTHTHTHSTTDEAHGCSYSTPNSIFSTEVMQLLSRIRNTRDNLINILYIHAKSLPLYVHVI